MLEIIHSRVGKSHRCLFYLSDDDVSCYLCLSFASLLSRCAQEQRNCSSSWGVFVFLGNASIFVANNETLQ